MGAEEQGTEQREGNCRVRAVESFSCFLSSIFHLFSALSLMLGVCLGLFHVREGARELGRKGGVQNSVSGQADVEIDEYVHVSGSVNSRYRHLLLCS